MLWGMSKFVAVVTYGGKSLNNQLHSDFICGFL